MKNNNKIKIDNFLISGDSFVDGKDWFTKIFEAKEIRNLGRAGAGNKFISESIITEIIEGFKPDFVLVVWSGLLRFDFPLSKKITSNNYNVYGDTKYSKYLFNYCAPFRDKSKNMPVQNELTDWLYNEKDYINVKSQSLLQILSCQNFLKANNIPYRFTFIYNFLDKNFDHNHLVNEKTKENGFMATLGSVDKHHPILNYIDQDMIIGPFGLDIGLRQGLLKNDGFHLTKKGLNVWANELAVNLNKNKYTVEEKI